MERSTADGALEALMASAAALVVVVPGPESAGACVPDPLRTQADGWLDSLQEACRLQAATAAFIVHAAAGFADATRAMSRPDEQPHQRLAQEMGIVSELACVMTVSERSASALLAQAHELTTALPLTLAALQSGDLSWQHSRVMVDETTGLDAAGAAALEARFLGPDVPDAAKRCPAGDLVPSRFRAKARTWRERHHPVSIEKRHARSVLDRRLEYVPDRDGMAWLSAYLPADQAAGIWNRTTATARTLQGPAETRTMTQLRADIAAQLLLSAGFTPSSPAAGSTDTAPGNSAGTCSVSVNGGVARSTSDGTRTSTGFSDGTATSSNDVVAGGVPAADSANASDVAAGQVPSPAAQVLVTVPVFALMGLTDEPADLDGYGPIPASMARKLVADGSSSFRRILVDPRDGAPLEIGRQSYRIPAAMRQWLRMRDGKCPFPGCNNQSLDNEADHILAWAHGGTTGASNLGQLCRKHHRLKHTTTWAPTGACKDKPPGWTSPTGRHYPSEHHDWEPPQLPAAVQDALHALDRTPARNRNRVLDPDSEPAPDPHPAMASVRGPDW
ncbi:DUF222 domain-containing protein [Pseudarthrobacter sp. NPDC055928]|uniref:HNH endonuclease signature motif containing protein n=1 Tax=Pseudarthrobacter sp. NPDC055928 TaxID=3345661 RepID=UPI0035DDF5A7